MLYILKCRQYWTVQLFALAQLKAQSSHGLLLPKSAENLYLFFIIFYSKPVLICSYAESNLCLLLRYSNHYAGDPFTAQFFFPVNYPLVLHTKRKKSTNLNIRIDQSLLGCLRLIFLLLIFSIFLHKLKKKTIYIHDDVLSDHSHKGLYTCSTEPSTQQWYW